MRENLIWIVLGIGGLAVAGVLSLAFGVNLRVDSHADFEALVLLFGGGLLLIHGLYRLLRRLWRKNPPAPPTE